MNFTVLSLFPEILRGFFESSIMARAVERGLVSYSLVNIRDFATDKHHKCDDEIYGGGPGMLMLPGPLGAALLASGARPKAVDGIPSSLVPAGGEASGTGAEARVGTAGGEADGVGAEGRFGTAGGEAASRPPRVVYLSPSGKPFSQALAHEFAREERLILLCGRYEGIDQRIIDRFVDDEVSVGDYVLSSGEVAALAVVDAVYRLLPGVITGESLEVESFSGGLLEHPQYTRPEIYDSLRVPEVLLSGHHANIERWRLRKRVEKTLRNRPELLDRADPGEAVRRILSDLESEGRPS